MNTTNNALSDKDTQAVLDILVEQIGVPREQLTPEARLHEDLGADSLLEVELVMALEDRFGISIPDEQLEGVSTVGDLFEMLGKMLASPWTGSTF